MKTKTAKNLAVLSETIARRRNGVLFLLKQRGYEVENPSIALVKKAIDRDGNLNILKEIFKLDTEAIRTAYAEGDAASATDWTDWAAAISSGLASTFSVLGASKDTPTDATVLATAAAQDAAAKAAEEKANTLKWVVIAVVALLAIVVVAVIIKKRRG